MNIEDVIFHSFFMELMMEVRWVDIQCTLMTFHLMPLPDQHFFFQVSHSLTKLLAWLHPPVNSEVDSDRGASFILTQIDLKKLDEDDFHLPSLFGERRLLEKEVTISSLLHSPESCNGDKL